MVDGEKTIAIISKDFPDCDLFGCGIFQNALLLYDLFNAMDKFKVVFLLSHREGGLISNSDTYESYVFADLEDLPFKIDVCIETTVYTEVEHKQLFKKHHANIKIVALRLGNFIAHDIDTIIYDVKLSKQMNAEAIDAVWISPQHQHAREYISTLYDLDSSKVAVAPYIWEPRFLDDRIAKIGKSYHELKFSPSDPKKIAVLEPNLSYVKNALVPILIMEEAYRVDPNAYEAAYVNWNDKSDDSRYYFLETFGRNCAIVRSETNKLYFIGRTEFVDIVNDGIKYIVSHQRDNALNYLYLEAAYLGLPLIHNSPFLSDFGYYYEDYNTKQGATALLRALAEHSNTLEDYNKSSAELLKKYSIDNPTVKNKYRQLIDSLFDKN